MQHSQSSVRKTPGRTEEWRQERSLTKVPDEQERRELPLRGVMDAIPGLVWSALPGGDVEFCNQRWLEYTGMSFNEIKGWGWAARI
jgi:hypothetical protein